MGPLMVGNGRALQGNLLCNHGAGAPYFLIC